MSFIGIPGLIISIISTLFLLGKSNVSSTAWIYTTLAIVAFSLAGSTGAIYIESGFILRITLATPFGLVGGYILIFLAINQYLHDKRMASTRSSNLDEANITSMERIQ